jgi:hypothetical protein
MPGPRDGEGGSEQADATIGDDHEKHRPCIDVINPFMGLSQP